VLLGSGGRPLPPTCPATLLPPLSFATRLKDETELPRLLMMINEGNGGLGDDGTMEEERDEAVLDTGESNTENGSGMTKNDCKKKRQNVSVPNLGNDSAFHRT
jgi:hypothetical protein